MKNFKSLLSNITTFVFDVDGVLTNGQLLVTEEGMLLRSMNIKDGYALQLAIKKGYEVIIISGANAPGVPLRLKNLGITKLFFGVQNKLKTLQSIVTPLQIESHQILCMGDDMPDIGMMEWCGIAACPADAVAQVTELCIYQSQLAGGMGCVRDVIEQTLRLHNNWE